MDFEFQLVCAMQESDLHISSINFKTGVYHRFKSEGTCRKKCCEYRVFENLLGAHFKCWRRGIDRVWFAKKDGYLTRQDKQQFHQERRRVNEDRQRNQQRLADKCSAFYLRCNTRPADIFHHPYVYKKLIKPYSARLCRRMVVIPVCNIDRNVQTLQFIFGNGFKKFKAGASSSHGMVWLSPQLLPAYSGIIRICEGWATGCTIRQVTDDPVICAMNAHNIPNVASALRKKFPASRIVVCSDNDQWKVENTGIKNAMIAARIANASICYPDFSGLDTSSKPTDFNDLFLLGGNLLALNQLNISIGE